MNTISVSTKTALPDPMANKYRDTEQIARAMLGSQETKKDPSDLRTAVKEFESYFISYLLTEMRHTVKPGLLPNKDGKQFYSFYDQEIGRLAAQSGGLGLAALLEKSLSQGAAPSGPVAP